MSNRGAQTPPRRTNPVDLHTPDFTEQEIAILERMNIYRRVWHPNAGWGTAGGTYATPPLVAPVVRFDRPAHQGRHIVAVCPWNLLYPN